MGHENAVYLAKLAEQAERYEGWSLLIDPDFRYRAFLSLT